ncbi:MAG TPA: hypothetical protein IAA80_03605 [Candidatus Gallacutalibacter pullistercoris]|nr:hypothetical protein [Candidatus Gallacutalibacter pullistercoris]
MILPYLSPISRTRSVLYQFGGYCHTRTCSDGQFYEMQNLSAREVPLLCPRRQRGKIRQFSSPNGVFGRDKLCWVDGTDFYYNGFRVGTVSNTEKQFVGMGAYLLIWPDKKYYNIQTGEFGDLGASFTTTGSTVGFILSKADGTVYEGYTTGAEAPSSPENGTLWLDTSQTPNILKEYSSATQSWVEIASTFVKISFGNLGKLFKQYDGVTVSGCTGIAEGINGSHIIQSCADDWIVVPGILDSSYNQSEPVTVSREIPDMDFLTESENRIWGCSSKNHEIYACKLGDPTNWNCFEGISTDSYAATIGSDGDFTGACTHLGYVLFFKEDMIHKVYGTRPANFQITNSPVRGVKKGSERSLVIVNETLYYHSRNGICAYDGSLPVSISAALGNGSYQNARAGTVGDSYYISMQKPDGGWDLFVYDEASGLWHREDDTQVKWFARVGGELYFIAGDNALYTVNGSTSLYEGDEGSLGETEDPVQWFCETGDMGGGLHEYLAGLQFCFQLAAGSSVTVRLQYDGGEWEEIAQVTCSEKRVFTLPVIPKRCVFLRIRLEGTGEMQLYSIAKTTESATELPISKM